MKTPSDDGAEGRTREPAWVDGPSGAPGTGETSTGAASPRWEGDGAEDAAPPAEPAHRRSPGGFRVSGQARPFELGPEPSPRSGLLMSLGSSSVALLLVALLLPSVGGTDFRGGWLDLGDVGGGSFLDLLSLVLLVLCLLVPMGRRARAIALTALGALVCAFGLSLVAEDVLRQVYRGHPGVEAFAFGDRWLLLCGLGALLLPAGLFGRRGAGGLLVPRVLGTAGAVAVVAAFLALPVGSEGANGVETLTAVLRDSDSFQGDRFAAALLLVPLAFSPSVLLLFLPKERSAPVSFLAIGFLLAVVAALVVLALHVAKPSHWLDALPALKSVLLLGAGLLLAPTALGELASQMGPAAHANPEQGAV